MASAKYGTDFREILTHYIPFLETILQDTPTSGNIVSEHYKIVKSSLIGLFTGSSKDSSETIKSIKYCGIPNPQQYQYHLQ